jgi:hypothetical protein
MTSPKNCPLLKTSGSLALARAINLHLHQGNPRLMNLVEQGLSQIDKELGQNLPIQRLLIYVPELSE